MPGNTLSHLKTEAKRKNKVTFSSELQEFRVCLTHHTTPKEKPYSEAAASSPVQHPEPLQHSLGKTEP